MKENQVIISPLMRMTLGKRVPLEDRVEERPSGMCYPGDDPDSLSTFHGHSLERLVLLNSDPSARPLQIISAAMNV